MCVVFLALGVVRGVLVSMESVRVLYFLASLCSGCFVFSVVCCCFVGVVAWLCVLACGWEVFLLVWFLCYLLLVVWCVCVICVVSVLFVFLWYCWTGVCCSWCGVYCSCLVCM